MDYQALVLGFLHQHQAAAAFVAGAIASHPAACADLVFKAAMKSPFKPLVLKFSPTVLSWADAFEAELAKNVKEEAAKDALPGAAPEPAASPK